MSASAYIHVVGCNLAVWLSYRIFAPAPAVIEQTATINTFTQADVFPIIARVIRKNYQRKNDWVVHKEIVSALLQDEAGVRCVLHNA